MVKNPPAMQETLVQFLGREDPLENRTATHFSILGLPWWLSRERIRLQCGRPFNPWVGKISWRIEQLPTPVFLGFPGGLAGKESACSVRDLGLIPGLGGSPWRRESLPTPVFWPGESHGLYSPWGLNESDTTERLSLSLCLVS